MKSIINNKINILMTIAICIISGCSDNGSEGTSYITIGFIEESIQNNENLDIEIEFININWDGEWDFIETMDDIRTIPNQLISPGTYEYLVTVTLSDSDNDESNQTIICSLDYPCPDEGYIDNPPIVIEPNFNGEDAPSLFENGANGQNRYYSFTVMEDGKAWIIGGTAEEINNN